MRLGAVLLLCVTVTTGCMSSTVIHSRPEGADVFSGEGVFIGTTPVVIANARTVLEPEILRIEKEGYQPMDLTIQRTEWHVGSVLFSCLFFLPTLLWSADYPVAYQVDLDQDPQARWQNMPTVTPSP